MGLYFFERKNFNQFIVNDLFHWKISFESLKSDV